MAGGDTRIEYVALDDLAPAHRNPKGHDLVAIRASIGRFGFVAPAIRDERTGRLVVGHGRCEALRGMRDAGEDPPAGIDLDPDGRWLVPVRAGWSSRSDVEAEAYLVLDNQHTIAGGWDLDELSAVVTDLVANDPALTDVLGFPDADLADLLGDGPTPDLDDLGDETDKGGLLELAGATVGEPDYEPGRGEVWWLGDHHVLVVANPHTEWAAWVHLLEDDAVLLPYPSPLAGLVDSAGRRVVMVQPSRYIAGWLLTKWARVTGQPPILDVAS